MHGTGQGDVDEAQKLGGVFELDFCLDLFRFVLVDRFAAVIDDRNPLIVVIFRSVDACATKARPAIPQIGTEHDRVFESLRLVDGDDLDQVLVGFQAQLGGLICTSFVALRAKVAQQPFRRGVRLRCLMQALAQMQEIGQASFAVGTNQHAAGDLFSGKELAVHGSEAAAQPLFAIVAELEHAFHEGGFIAGDGFDCCGVTTDQFGC